MRPAVVDGARWEDVLTCSDCFTCYSAAMATWLAAEDERWRDVLDPGLWLTIVPHGDVFGFGYWPPQLRARLGLVRAGSDDPAQAVAAVLAEVERSGRAIVAGETYNLPWHLARGRDHLPHWYVLATDDDALVAFDAFEYQTELGMQRPVRQPVAEDELQPILRALPPDDPVLRLREELAFGDDAAPLDWRRYQWFVRQEDVETRSPGGVIGAEAIRLLSAHFVAHAQEPEAYAQADDIWSIARHRAFLLRDATRIASASGDAELAAWIEERLAPLARRWGHIAPLLLQATLALQAGRPASGSVAEVLAELAGLEEAAAAAAPRQIGLQSG